MESIIFLAEKVIKRIVSVGDAIHECKDDYSRNFIKGLSLLIKHEPSPSIDYMGGGEFYVGDMNKWEHLISDHDFKLIFGLGWHLYEEAECLLFNNSTESIYH